MKIAIAGGHSKAAQGAASLLNEYECDRAYVAQLIPALMAAGYEVVDCSNEESTIKGELAAEVRAANDSKADLFLAVHFNAGGGSGTECYYYEGSGTGREYAARLSANVATALGLPDRGAKDNKTFYVLRNTKMTAILLEVCFVDRQEDKDAWDRTSWAALTSAVVSALGGEQAAPATATEPTPAPAPEPSKPSEGFGGRYVVNASKLNIRDRPSLSGAVVGSYSKGQTVVLDDDYTIADGYVWGQYTAYSGNRRYVAVGKATGKPEANDYLVKA